MPPNERVLYERTLKGMKNREFTSQYLSPPIILTLTMQEAQLLNENMDRFARIGFEIEPLRRRGVCGKGRTGQSFQYRKERSAHGDD